MKFNIKRKPKDLSVKEKPKDLIIKRNIIRTMWVYLIISLIITSGLYFERYLVEPYKYLLISPSFYNYPYLNWTTSVWGSFLGIHGTIAALSITFMGMFVGQVSTSSEYGFESLSKVLLLREYQFLEFSIQSVSSLLCGLFLLLTGSGLLGYFVSACLSLYFIIRYGMMYFRLYNLTEKPEIINGVLFDAIQKTGEKYKEINMQQQKLNDDFSHLIVGENYFTDDQSIVYWKDDAISLNVFPSTPDVVISGFNPTIFERLSSKITELNQHPHPIIYFHISFLAPLSNSIIKIIPPENTKMADKFVSEIEEILKKHLSFSSTPYIYGEFKQFEEALVNNIRNSLLNGDEWSLDFGVRTFYELTSYENYTFTLRNIDLSITSSNKKDIIETSLLAKFFEKMISEATNRNDSEKSANIMRSLIELSRYIYSNNSFFEFYKRVFRFFEHRARYRTNETNYIFLDLYLSNVIRNLVYGYYKAFELDTDFITSKMQYLDLNNRGDYDTLNEMQRKMLRCLFEIITLLIMRIEHVMKKDSDAQEEVKNIIKALKAWVNCKFLNELYFKTELYDLLFSIPDEYSVFDAETKMREIPDGEATWRSISNDTYKMIAFILTQNSFNSNQLNLLFVRNIGEFKQKTGIRTHELNSIISYLKGDSFSELLNFITNEEETKTNKEQVITKLESMISLTNSLILREVIDSELDPDLVDKYAHEIKTAVEKHFDLILHLDNIHLEDDIHGIEFYLLVDKREVLPPIDGVSCEMNIHNHSQWLIYNWIREALNNLKKKAIQIIDINSLQDLKTEKLITIEYKVKDRVNTYKYSKGLKIDDKEGYLNLSDSGMYYLNLHENFTLKRTAEILTVNISRIIDSNIQEIEKHCTFEDKNPYLYTALNAVCNVVAVPNEDCTLYFLSEEKCRAINEKQEKEMEQLFKSSRANLSGDHNVSD